jgi:tRNA (pseudouridine54-N1)-methyltransferase
MKSFLFYSAGAPTKGNFGTDLMKAGRLDISLHAIIAAFFVSNEMRQDTNMHLVFDGHPTPPRHLTLIPSMGGIEISKKDVLHIIKKLLYKYREGENREIEPGYLIEKRSLQDTAADLAAAGSDVFILDGAGEDIRTIDIGNDPVFILGDHEGIPRKERKGLKKAGYKRVSVGPKVLFASQAIILVQNELDRREPVDEIVV